MRIPFASAAGAMPSSAERTTSGRSTGWTLRRIFPATIREMSSTSSTIWMSDVALRIDGVQGFGLFVRSHRAGAEHACVAKNRVQRRAQFVREARQELVFDPTRLLHARVQARVLKGDRCPRRDAAGEPLVLIRKPPGLRVPEEESPDDLATACLDRHRQIASYGEGARAACHDRARCGRTANPS
jgi:hypothetical protein